MISLLTSLAGTITAQPDWASEEHTTSQFYRFTTDLLEPVPEVVRNPYGLPAATVLVTEPFGAGWQDPADVFSISGVNEDGAWDVGPGGNITISVPVAPFADDPTVSNRVEFFVRLVAYEMPVALPVIQLPGLVLEEEVSTTTLEKQDTLGRYMAVTWSAGANVAGSNMVTFVLAATSGGALIDSVEIQTRLIPAEDGLSGYSSWAALLYPGIDDPDVIGFGAAPDGDGIPNGMKYFLGLERTEGRPVITLISADADALIFAHRRNLETTPDVADSYEWSPDLLHWHQAEKAVDGVSVYFTAIPMDPEHPDFAFKTVAAIAAPEIPRRFFVRLKVTQLESNPS